MHRVWSQRSKKALSRCLELFFTAVILAAPPQLLPAGLESQRDFHSVLRTLHSALHCVTDPQKKTGQPRGVLCSSPSPWEPGTAPCLLTNT